MRDFYTCYYNALPGSAVYSEYCRHALLKKHVIEELLPACETDDDRFQLECRRGETNGVIAACEASCHSRYLFIAHNPADATRVIE